MGFFDKLKNGLSKTKTSIDDKINGVFSTFRKVDEELLEELEEALIMSDIGMNTSLEIISNLRDKVKKQNVKEAEEVKELLREEIENILEVGENTLKLDTTPSVVLVIRSKWSTEKPHQSGKIANKLKMSGKKVMIAAADTFRAAAVEQLEVWSKRANCDIIKCGEGVDPASVVYEAIQKAKETKADVLICDTAGRLHNKKYLMDELEKIQRVIDKELPEASKESLLVIDRNNRAKCNRTSKSI